MTTLDIIYEDPDILVINKPAGLIVHEVNEGDVEPTLVDAIVKHVPTIKNVGDDPVRPGIVHRLDRDVSGVMVIAKTPESFETLKAAFKERTVVKEYIALVYGQLPKEFDTITLNIGRSQRSGRMVGRPTSQDGMEAITDYEVIERFRTATLAKVNIKTGRMHQIRAHMFAVGHPVVGDTLHTRVMKKIRPIELGRVFLHAAKLTIPMLDGSSKTFEAPMPNELTDLLAKMPKQQIKVGSYKDRPSPEY